MEIYIFAGSSKTKIIANLSFALLAAGISFMIFSSNPSYLRSIGQLQQSSGSSDAERIENLRHAVNTAPVWITGYGFGCFKRFHPKEVHNTAFSLIVETGFIGFAVAVVFFVNILGPLFKKKARHVFTHDIHSLLMLCLFSVVFHSMIHNLVTSRISWLIIAVCAAAANVVDENKDSEDAFSVND